jgi:hypothetical protein
VSVSKTGVANAEFDRAVVVVVAVLVSNVLLESDVLLAWNDEDSGDCARDIVLVRSVDVVAASSSWYVATGVAVDFDFTAQTSSSSKR